MKFENNEVRKSIELLTEEYLQSLFQLMSFDPGLEEFDLFKTYINTPDGGKYLLHIHQIDGPKILFNKAKPQKNKECDVCGCLQTTHGCTDLECKWRKK